MTWWSIDPGAVHIGVARWENDVLVEGYEDHEESFVRSLYEATLDFVVVESYSLLTPMSGKSNTKESVKTLELIGMIRGLCWVKGIHLYKQTPSVRHIAMKSRYWNPTYQESGLDFPKGNDHIRSAIAHGVYYLRFNKQVKESV